MVPTQELIKACRSLLQVRFRTTQACENVWTTTPGGGGGTPHIKGGGMLVVSLRGVNFGFLVPLKVFWAKHHHI